MTAKRATLVTYTAIGLLALALIPIALAGRGGTGKPGGSGSYHVTVSPDGPYFVGQSVYTTTDAPIYPNNQGPWISMTCFVNGQAMVGWTHAGFPGGWYYNWPYKLDGWGGGPADCTVTVWHQSNNKNVTDATTSFHVNG
jgi:hypothetical protein